MCSFIISTNIILDIQKKCNKYRNIIYANYNMTQLVDFLCLLSSTCYYFIYVDIDQIGNYGLGLLVFVMLIWSALYNISKMDSNK